MEEEKRVVCLDPGHPSYFKNGKINWGAESTSGLREVEVNLIIAKLVKERLKNKSFKVTLTRVGNQKVVDNAERIKIAKDFGTQLIIRLHCDWGDSLWISEEKNQEKMAEGISLGIQKFFGRL